VCELARRGVTAREESRRQSLEMRLRRTQLQMDSHGCHGITRTAVL
jgi:hypothetical protein